MKLSDATTFWTLALTAASLAAPAAPKEPAAVPEAVALLSDESYAVRERATRDLWKLGEKALPELRKALDGEDPEAELRARDLIRKIELGILPDSSPKIADLVVLYDRGTVEEKRRVIAELKRERAFRQILKLYALENEEDTLAMLEEGVRGVAVEAARDCLASEPPDVAGAFSYLGMARPEAAELIATAALHRATGTLEEELGKAAQLDGEQGHRWRYALLAAAGRLGEAAAEAEKAGMEKTSARLQLLAGNPVPWLVAAAPPPRAVPPAGLDLYRQFAIRTWERKPVPAEVTRTLRRQARLGDDDDQAKELRLLFLTGDLNEAEKRLVELDRTAAFYYFESSERIEDALAALGLDPAEPDYKAWALKRFRTLPDEDSDGNEAGELALLGHFLEHRGLLKELDDVFVEPLVELSRADQEIYFGTINRLLRGRASMATVRPVIQSIARFAGDDEVRWAMVVANLFDFLKDPDRLWSWTAALDPDLDPPQRLEWLCRIFGFLPDVDGDRDRFFELAWKSIDGAEGAARPPMIELMAALDDLFQDKENTLRCLEALEREDDLVTLQQKAWAYSNLGRWSEAAANWLKVVEQSPGNALARVHAAACLRRAGEPEAADVHEKRADLLALGELQLQLNCGNVFALAGDFERAACWWQRAAVECTRETVFFQDVLGRLADHAQATGDWQAMAAYAEAQAFHQAAAGNSDFRVQPAFSMAVALKARIDASLARAFSRLDRDRAGALEEIERWAAMPYAENAMADYFFAPMRALGLTRLHDKVFVRMWRDVTRRIDQFPDCDNSRNSAAWLASRANRRLDEATAYLEKALERNPRQAAYLDTMAEIHFARGDRRKAVELSARAVEEGALDFQIMRQYHRFAEGSFPPK